MRESSLWRFTSGSNREPLLNWLCTSDHRILSPQTNLDSQTARPARLRSIAEPAEPRLLGKDRVSNWHMRALNEVTQGLLNIATFPEDILDHSHRLHRPLVLSSRLTFSFNYSSHSRRVQHGAIYRSSPSLPSSFAVEEVHPGKRCTGTLQASCFRHQRYVPSALVTRRFVSSFSL